MNRGSKNSVSNIVSKILTAECLDKSSLEFLENHDNSYSGNQLKY